MVQRDDYLSVHLSCAAMGYISTGMGNLFGALPVSLMALRLTQVDQNPFRPCRPVFSKAYSCFRTWMSSVLLFSMTQWVV